jgi:hypothetical protein
MVLAHRHEPYRVRLATGSLASLVDAAADAGEVFLKFGHAARLHQNWFLRDEICAETPASMANPLGLDGNSGMEFRIVRDRRALEIRRPSG